jgi:hypothetical protein
MPADVVYVGRPSLYGNPFQSTDRRPERPSDRLRRVEHYRLWLVEPETRRPWFGREANDRRARLLGMLGRLRGRDLACWCSLDEPCHADVLLDLANR